MEGQTAFPRWVLVPLALLVVNGLVVFGIYLSGAYSLESVPRGEYKRPSCAEIKDDLNPVTHGLLCPENH